MAAVRAITASVQRDDELRLDFRMEGDIDQLWLPEPAAPRRVEGLWQHTCFEAFVGPEALLGYHEFNFAPSGEWAAFAFHSYRSGVPLKNEAVAPVIKVQRGDGWLELTAQVQLDALSRVYARAALRVALSAVIEDRRGNLSYWALAHPSESPDFHHPDAFVLRLPAVPEAG